MAKERDSTLAVQHEVNRKNHDGMARLRKQCTGTLVKHIKLSMAKAFYKPENIIDVLTYAAMTRGYPESAVAEMRLAEPPRKRGVPTSIPSADTVLSKIAGKAQEEIVVEMNNALGELVRRGRKAGDIVGEIDAAIDTHNKYRYSKNMRRERKKNAEDLKFVKGTKPVPGTSYAHQYLTVYTINARNNYTLSFTPWTQFQDIVDCAEKAIRDADVNLGKPIRCIYMDCGGYSVEMLKMFQRLGKHYVVRAPKDNRITKLVGKASGLWCWFERDYELSNGKESVKTNIVVVDIVALKARKHDFPLVKEEEKYLTFATDLLPEDEENLLDFCVKIAVNYKGRWGIETSYRDQNEFEANTHSLSYSVRVFLFALSIILYNLWQLVNVLFSRNETFMRLFRGKMTKYLFSFVVSMLILESFGIVSLKLR